jgi:hypothetical protein
MQVPVGCVPGQVPHAQLAPPPPPPPTQVQLVAPYEHVLAAAHAPNAGWHVPVGWAVGQAGQVVHVQTGLPPPPPPPPQLHTTLPLVPL